MPYKLSKYFTLEEMTKSQIAVRNNIDNWLYPDEQSNLVSNLRELCVNCLDPIREKFGPFSPNSAYRSYKLNAFLGSSDNSQHVIGQAADIEVPGVSNLELAHYIKNNLPYDQLILEFYSASDPHSGWVHVSYTTYGKNRKQSLTFDGKKYQEGLPKLV